MDQRGEARKMTRTPIYYLESFGKAKLRWKEMKKRYNKPDQKSFRKQIAIFEILEAIRYKPKTRYVVAHMKRAEVNLNLKKVKRLR